MSLRALTATRFMRIFLIRPNYKHLKSVHKSILEACFDLRECFESIRRVDEINLAVGVAPNGLMATHLVTNLR